MFGTQKENCRPCDLWKECDYQDIQFFSKNLKLNSNDEALVLKTTLWQILTIPDHEVPDEDTERSVSAQYKDKEFWLMVQLKRFALRDVIVFSAQNNNPRPYDIWKEYNALYSIVTFDDVARGTSELYSGKVPQGFKGTTPTDLVTTMKH